MLKLDIDRDCDYSSVFESGISSARDPIPDKKLPSVVRAESFSSYLNAIRVGEDYLSNKAQDSHIEKHGAVCSLSPFPNVSSPLSPHRLYFQVPSSAMSCVSRGYLSSNFRPSVVFKHPGTKLTLSQLEGIKKLCRGSKSRLFRARYDKYLVVLKLLDMSKYDQLVQQEFDTEIALLSNISHTNIIQSHGFGTAITVDEVTKKSNQVPFIVLELLSGRTLSHHLSLERPFYSRPFTELRYLQMIKELAAALSYLHYHAHKDYIIIHRDLKPDNIGFTLQGTLKLLDFGLSTCIPRHSEANGDNGTSVYEMSGSTGSLRYMAPEVALNQPYNEKVDIYSFGMIAYEIISGFTPFKGYSRDKLNNFVICGNDRPSLSHDMDNRKIKMHENIREIIKLSWDADYSKRPTSEMLYSIITQTELILSKAHTKKNVIKRVYYDLRNRLNTI